MGDKVYTAERSNVGYNMISSAPYFYDYACGIPNAFTGLSGTVKRVQLTLPLVHSHDDEQTAIYYDTGCPFVATGYNSTSGYWDNSSAAKTYPILKRKGATVDMGKNLTRLQEYNGQTRLYLYYPYHAITFELASISVGDNWKKAENWCVPMLWVGIYNVGMQACWGSEGSAVITLTIEQNNTIYYATAGTWKQCEVYYGVNGGWKQCETKWGTGGNWVDIGG